MRLQDFFSFWEMLLRFSTKAWNFLNLSVGSAVWDFVESVFPDVFVKAIRLRAIAGGFGSAEAMLQETFVNLTVLELCLGSGIAFVIGYKLITWLLDVFF